MPTIAQIRAARALLDWSQSDLADYAGLSQTGIARIENGTNKPNSRTIEKIDNAFDHADIEFIGDTGVKKRTGEIKTYKGQEGFKTFMDDVYETAKNSGGDICLFNGMPEYFYKHLGQEWYEEHSNRMNSIKQNFKLKITVKEGEELLIASKFAEYKHFPAELFKEQTFYAYGEKLAIMTFTEETVVIRVLSEKDIATSFKILFNIAWKNVAKKIIVTE